MQRLELVRKLGDGSAVESFLGRVGNTHYLVQLSRPELVEATDLMGRFLDSTATLAAHHHPELLTPHTVTMTSQGRFLLSSDAITGWTAADLLRYSGAVPPAVVAQWGVTLCEAVAALHARGQTHGCLAPRHLHLSGTSDCPSIRLADTTLLHFRAGASFAPASDVVVVEPHYLSPERASGARGVPQDDVWGIGVLLVELLTGRAPFRANTRAESLALIGRAQAPRLGPSLAAWNAVLSGALDPVAANRFGSALEVRQALLTLI